MTSPRADTAFTRWLAVMVPAVLRTDAELARLAEVDAGTVTRWHKGSLPHAAQIQKLCKITDTGPGTLLAIIAASGPDQAGAELCQPAQRLPRR